MVRFKRSAIAFCGIIAATASLCSANGFAEGPAQTPAPAPVPAQVEEEPYARVRAIGSVTLDGNSVREEEIIRDGAEIKTEKDSYADIEIHATASHLTVNPNSVLILHRPKNNGDESHVLKDGAVRAKVNHRSDRNFKIHTAPAIFGVRGTDFIVTTNPLFNDAEVVVLKGSVEVTSTSDPLDAKLIQAGEWAGIGGRYGKKVTEPLKVSESSLKAIDKKNSTPGFVSYSASSQKSTSTKKSSAESSRSAEKPSSENSSNGNGIGTGNKAE